MYNMESEGEVGERERRVEERGRERVGGRERQRARYITPCAHTHTHTHTHTHGDN